jgi:glucosamine-6-phosphate deaminase
LCVCTAKRNLDFSRVTTFNLDEYYPLQADAAQSYRRLCASTCSTTSIARSGTFPMALCAMPQLLSAIARITSHDPASRWSGFTASGNWPHRTHGFNEPGSASDTRTRLVTLDHLTRADAAADFFGIENVPVRAITMGMGTILDARRIVLMATGTHKAPIVREAMEDKITSKVPASLLRRHDNVQWFLDEAAASDLVEYSRPWRAANADFSDEKLLRRTLLTVSHTTHKPLAQLSAMTCKKLEPRDWCMKVPSLSAALATGGGRLRARLDDEKHLPQGQSVFCLSPHPDDDVICCGATLLKMAQRDNNVSVAYGVSGFPRGARQRCAESLRARDERFVRYIEELEQPRRSFEEAFTEVRQFIFEREAGHPDSPLLT